MALKVLHIGKFYPPYHGGMEVFLADLIRAQKRQGLDVAAIVHGSPLPDDPSWLVRVPVQVKMIYAPIALGFRGDLAKVIHEFQPDYLHLHLPNASALWVLTLEVARTIPWVVHWQSDVVASPFSRGLAFAYRFYRPFEQALLARAYRIIVTSPPYLASSQPLIKWQSKCVVIPLGIDLERLARECMPTGDDNLPWLPDRVRLLSIGRLTYYKGFETLICAALRLPQVQLIVVGDGDLREQLQALIDDSHGHENRADQSGFVTLIGAVDDTIKNALLASCDVFCLASRERTEAFGMVLLEAFHFGKPCVVSAVEGSGMPWLVQQANAGLLAPADDAEAWQSTLAQLARDSLSRQQLGLNAQQAANGFAIDTVTQAITFAYGAESVWQSSLTVEKLIVADSEKILIVIPAQNEAATIGPLVQQLRAKGWCHVVVVDDQSTDNSAALASDAGAQVMRPLLPLGAWGAMQAGIRYGLQNGFTTVITMDADGQHEVAELPGLYSARGQSDVVIGAFPARASPARRIAWWWFRVLTGCNVHDLTSGFRCYNLAAMQVLSTQDATLLEYQDVGTLLVIRKAGLCVTELPVNMKSRIQGRSKIFSSWWMVAKYMLVTTLLCLSRWDLHKNQSSADQH